MNEYDYDFESDCNDRNDQDGRLDNDAYCDAIERSCVSDC